MSPSGADGFTVEQIADHKIEARARVREQYKTATKFLALLDALVSPCNDLETALYQLYYERNIDRGVGVQLDDIGEIVGQPRGGLSDATYRGYLRARIATNKSGATIETLIRIVRAVLNNPAAGIKPTPYYPAAIAIQITNEPLTEVEATSIITFLRDAKAGGVKLVLEYSTSKEGFRHAQYFTQLDGSTLASATSFAVDSTEGFPESGTLLVGAATANEEELTYTVTSPTEFTVAAATNAHADNTAIQLAVPTGRGFDDSSGSLDAGELAGAKE